jgi:CRP/FNR family transcriptional regulator, cyclic AMP receptor protein
MFLEEYLTESELKPLLKTFDSGEYMFRQGEMGNCMYVIMDGMVQLFNETGEEHHLMGTFGPGQFFGEKALLSSNGHQRFFSALAQVKTTVLAVTLQKVLTIEKVIPDFMVLMFQAAAHRLDKAYYLIRILQSKDDSERVIHSLLYFFRATGVSEASRGMVPVTADDIGFLLNMDKNVIKSSLDRLVSRSILIKRPNESYLLRDERALILELASLGMAKPAP